MMMSLCKRRCTLGRSMLGMSVQSVVKCAGMPPCVRMLRLGIERGSRREKRSRRGVSVATHGGPCEMRSVDGSGDDSVLAYTAVRAFLICASVK